MENREDLIKESASIIEEIKSQIRAHMAKAEGYQPQIEDLAAKTINELKKVLELNEKLEELNLEAVSCVESMKVELNEKVGATHSPVDIQSSLDNEIDKLKKIKELLGKDSSHSLPEVVENPGIDRPQSKIVEQHIEEQLEKAEIPVKEEETDANIPVLDLNRTLEKCRKSIDGEKGIKLTYFENQKKMILDGQDIFDAIDKDVEEVQKLYDKLSKTQSPKEQFFTKQEIMWHQETLREFILTTIKVCEKEHAIFSQSTVEVLNMGVLKKIFDKVSQENWSDKDYFSSFFQFASELKAAYLEKTTPKTNHLKSLIDELELGQ